MFTSDTTGRFSKNPNATKDATHEASDAIGNAGDKIVQGASEMGDDMKAQLSDLTHETKVYAKRALNVASSHVRTHPATSLGLAAGMGLLAGLMLAGRR